MSLGVSVRTQQRLVATAVLLLGGVTAAVTVLASATQAGGSCGTGYPYAGLGGGSDPNGFFAPEMRSYVAACLNATGSDFARTERGPNGGTATFGEPTSWDATASSLGFGVTAAPAVGLIAQLRTGGVAPLFGAQGKPAGTLRGGDVVGYVDAVYGGGQVLMRTYDTNSRAIRSFRITAPRYLRLSGGSSVRGTPQPSKTPAPSASPTVTPTPTPSGSPPTPSAETTVTPTASAVATASARATTPPPAVVNNPPAKTSKSLASRYGKLIGIGGVVIAVVLGIIVIIASRRTDDIGD